MSFKRLGTFPDDDRYDGGIEAASETRPSVMLFQRQGLRHRLGRLLQLPIHTIHLRRRQARTPSKRNRTTTIQDPNSLRRASQQARLQWVGLKSLPSKLVHLRQVTSQSSLSRSFQIASSKCACVFFLPSRLRAYRGDLTRCQRSAQRNCGLFHPLFSHS